MAEKKEEKVSWLKRAVSKTKATEEETLGSFQSYSLKVYNKTLKSYKADLEKLLTNYEDELEKEQEILKELQAEVGELSVDVSVKEIATRSQRESYFLTFDSKVNKALDNVIAQSEKIKFLEKVFTDNCKKCSDRIEKIENKIALLS